MRRVLNRSKNVLRVATLIWIVAVPIWSEEEPAQRELGPDERRALEVVQQVMESGEFANRDEASDAVLLELTAEFGQGHPVVVGLTHTLAVQFHQEGRYGKARQLFEQLVEVWTEIEGEDHPSTLSALNNLAIVLQDQGDLPKALEIKKRVLAARSRILGEGHTDTLKAKGNLANTLFALGDLAGARAREEEVLAARDRILGEEHPDTLSAKMNLAGTLFALGDLAEAGAHSEEVLAARSRILGEEHPDTLKAKWGLAVVLKALGDLAGARSRQEEVLAAFSRILGEEHPDTLTAKGNLAVTLKALGDLAGARTREEEVLAARSRILGEEHPDTLTAKANLALTLKSLGDLAGARAREEEVLGAFSRILGEEHPDTLNAKANLAVTLKALGDLAGARTREEEVLGARSRILGEEHPDTLKAKGNLANTLSALGDLAGARDRKEEVLAARSRIFGEEHPDTLTAEANLAGILSALGDLVGARAREEKVLAARSRILGEEHPDTLTAKANLARTLSALGDHAGARAREEDALAARSRILGEEHPDTLESLHNVAVTYEDMGDFKKALSSYERIILSHRRVQGEYYFPVTENEAKTLLGLGRVHQATGELDQAQEAFGLALDAIEAQTEQLDLSEEMRRRYRASFQVGYHSALAVAVARHDTALALQLSERYRAGNLRTLLRTHRPGSLPDMPAEMKEQLRSIAAEYDGITRTLDGLHPRRNPVEYRNVVDRQIKLRRDREVLQSQWLREQLKNRDRNPPLDLRGIQSQLDLGTVLLVYNVGTDQTQLFVLSRDGELVARSIDLGRTTLWQQVRRFRELVDSDDLKTSDPEARDKLGRWLFTKLVPSDERLEPAERWLILADGPLHMLPFGALVRPKEIPGNWHYLAQHKPLHTVQSAATYAELRGRRGDSVQVAEGSSVAASWVGFGDPVYPVQVAELKRDEAKDGRRILRLGEERAIFDGLVELPNTEREIHEIGRLLPKGTTHAYLEAAATEEQAWSDLTHARIIHFATHGVALPYLPEIGMDPMDSFLALSLFDEAELEKRGLTRNGLLQAWEIVDLKLDADLVVLSACQTAIGEDQAGDGLISLSRAFQIAGARSVLASLWTVNDLSTSEFMIRFYKYLLAGKTKDVALQEAQKEFIAGPIEIVDEDGNAVLHDFSHPYYWAAFQLIGDWQ